MRRKTCYFTFDNYCLFMLWRYSKHSALQCCLWHCICQNITKCYEKMPGLYILRLLFERKVANIQVWSLTSFHCHLAHATFVATKLWMKLHWIILNSSVDCLRKILILINSLCCLIIFSNDFFLFFSHFATNLIQYHFKYLHRINTGFGSLHFAHDSARFCILNPSFDAQFVALFASTFREWATCWENCTEVVNYR